MTRTRRISSDIGNGNSTVFFPLSIPSAMTRAAFGAERELIRAVSGHGYQLTGEIRILPARPDERAGAGAVAA